jgi:hypothetical protein
MVRIFWSAVAVLIAATAAVFFLPASDDAASRATPVARNEPSLDEAPRADIEPRSDRPLPADAPTPTAASDTAVPNADPQPPSVMPTPDEDFAGADPGQPIAATPRPETDTTDAPASPKPTPTAQAVKDTPSGAAAETATGTSSTGGGMTSPASDSAEATPAPEADKPATEPTPAPEPDPEPASQPTPQPEPASPDTPEATADPVPDAEPAPVEKPEPTPEPAPEAAPAPASPADEQAPPIAVTPRRAPSPADPTPETTTAKPVVQTPTGLVLDGRHTVEGKGTKDKPYKIDWDMLVAVQRDYQPRLGKTAIPEWIKALDGKVVTIRGYALLPMGMSSMSELLVMLNQWDSCCIGVPPTPFDAIEVRLAKDLSPQAQSMFSHTGALSYGDITGTFKVDPYIVQGYLLGLYLMEDASANLLGPAGTP